MTDDDDPYGLLAALGDARFQFWICPIDGHGDSRPDANGGPTETVRWVGNIAHCTWPGCGRTSADKDAEVSP